MEWEPGLFLTWNGNSNWIVQTAGGYQLELIRHPPSIPPSTAAPTVCGAAGNTGAGGAQSVAEKSNRGMSRPRRFLQLPFIIPKEDGGWRTIINLKTLNRYLRVQHFKMESIYSVRDVLHRGDWMTKLDLQDAYLTVPIFHSHRRFLRFQWRAQAYQFRCLPFGLATAP